MDKQYAERLLSGSLKFGDAGQIAAKEFLDALAQAREAAQECKLCRGRGVLYDETCECLSDLELPEDVIEHIFRHGLNV